MKIPLNVIKFCAEECARQKSGELSVFWMCDAWMYAWNWDGWFLSVDDVLNLGARVEPVKNHKGFRTTPVRFANGDTGAPASTISDAIERLLENADPFKDRKGFYEAFERIHPFADGNGRVGAILYNLGRLDEPETPPNLFCEPQDEHERMKAIAADYSAENNYGRDIEHTPPKKVKLKLKNKEQPACHLDATKE